MSFKTRINRLDEEPYVRSLFYGTHIWFGRIHRQLRIYVFVLVSCALIHGEKLLLKRLPPLGDLAPCVPVPSFQKPWSGHHPHGPTRHGRRLPESVAVGNRLPEPPLRADAFAGFRRGADSFTVDNTLRPRCQKLANESSRRRKSANAVRAESDDVSGGLTEVFLKPDYSVGYLVDLQCRLIKKVNQICWLTSENPGRVDWIRTSDPLTPRHTQKI